MCKKVTVALVLVAGADGPGGAGDTSPEQRHVQQQVEELQAGDGQAGEGLCESASLLAPLVQP